MSKDRLVIIPPLATFRAQLRAIGPEWPRRLRVVNKKAADRVAAAMRGAYSQKYTRRSGRGERSIRALATQGRAQVAFGSASTPYMLGQNFGSAGRYPQFPFRTDPDHFAFRTIRSQTDNVVREYGNDLDDLFREAFPD
mgnify:CR=1 FL=1